MRRLTCIALAVLIFPSAALFFSVSAPLYAATIATGNVTPPLPWSSSTDPRIGNTGSGAITVNGGSTLASRTSRLGYDSGATGQATITDPGSKWTNSGYLYVGLDGSGTLRVENGALVSNSNLGVLGSDTGSAGEATITGPGSQWTSNSSLFLGNSGSGTLRVENGGLVSSTAVYMGFNSNATGEATITGPGSKWTSSFDLYVGRSGSGAISVEAGGVVNNTAAFLGYNSGSTGEAKITGPGSKWISSGELSIGRDGSGTLTVADGGLVTAGTLYASLNDLHGDGTITSIQGAVLDAVLRFDASHGMQAVTSFGSGGTLIVTANDGGSLGAGYKGLGSLTVAEGIAITSSTGYLGLATGSTGEATIIGPSSKWTIINDLFVGRRGNGTLRLENGGLVSNSADVYMGNYSGASGETRITGPGSRWTIRGSLNVGYQGSAILLVEGGGLVSNSLDGYLGFSMGATGKATITGPGSKWTNSGDLYVALSGSGTLRVEDGGQVSNSYGYLGDSLGATGEATIKGPGSKWTNSRGLLVGGDGSGTLRVEDGGEVNNNFSYLGDALGATGEATITGSGSKWVNASGFFVGASGSGTLRVQDGGEVSNDFGYLGDALGATGEATITGLGSKWTSSGGLFIGNNGRGMLTITRGGLVTVRESLTVDFNTDGDSFLNMATGGMLALFGNADDTLTQFLNLVQGTDAIRYWNKSIAAWAPIYQATFGVDYTLEYLTEGELTGYTLLTVGAVPEPVSIVLAVFLCVPLLRRD